MKSAERFDFVAACEAIARATPIELWWLVENDPRMKRLADNIAANVAAAPPFTPEQREGIRAVFRGA